MTWLINKVHWIPLGCGAWENTDLVEQLKPWVPWVTVEVNSSSAFSGLSTDLFISLDGIPPCFVASFLSPCFNFISHLVLVLFGLTVLLLSNCFLTPCLACSTYKRCYIKCCGYISNMGELLFNFWTCIVWTYLFGKAAGFIVGSCLFYTTTKLRALSIKLPGRLCEDLPVPWSGILDG